MASGAAAGAGHGTRAGAAAACNTSGSPPSPDSTDSPALGGEGEAGGSFASYFKQEVRDSARCGLPVIARHIIDKLFAPSNIGSMSERERDNSACISSQHELALAPVSAQWHPMMRRAISVGPYLAAAAHGGASSHRRRQHQQPGPRGSPWFRISPSRGPSRGRGSCRRYSLAYTARHVMQRIQTFVS